MNKKRTPSAIIRFSLLVVCLSVLLSGGIASALEEKPVVFADFSWDSAQFHNRVAGFILEHGFGRKVLYNFTEEMPGFLGLERGDFHLAMETWVDNSATYWAKAEKQGKIISLGRNYEDAPQGWYVPAYVVRGDTKRGIKALAPDLRTVADLARYWEIFMDPEDNTRGRFLNGPTGWPISGTNVARLKAYGLDSTFRNFYAGSGAALAVGIAGAYERGIPVVAYYWEPTPLLGRYDMIKLEESPYDEAVWKKNGGCAFPACRVLKTGNSGFLDSEPEIRKFIEKYATTLALTNAALASMEEKKSTHAQAAEAFLRDNPELWKSWLDEDRAGKVQSALDRFAKK